MQVENRRDFLKKTVQMTGAGMMVSSGFFSQRVTMSADNLAEVGTVLPKWENGEMDIHFIFTGVGESAFHIYPDGTTMLLDAGDRNTDAYAKNVRVLPDKSRRAGEWIARYIERVHPNPDSKVIDYMMLSHYHDDHGGGRNGYAGKAEGRGDYLLSGLSHVAEFWKFNVGYDRGYPDDSRPVPVTDPETYQNFRKFTQWKEQQGELRMEEFEVGKLDQIHLQYQPEKYDFHVRNLCRNGVVWTGKEGENVDFFEKYPHNKKAINENSLSLGLLYSYGPFRFFTAGDYSGRLTDNDGNNLLFERYAGKAAGRVDVCKANHHSYKDAMIPEFVQEVQARVYAINVWDRLHTQDNTMTNMSSQELYPGERLICTGQMEPEEQEEFKNCPWMKNVGIATGHMVVRVFDGGRKYKVYFLTAQDESMKITAVYGPFNSYLAENS